MYLDLHRIDRQLHMVQSKHKFTLTSILPLSPLKSTFTQTTYESYGLNLLRVFSHGFKSCLSAHNNLLMKDNFLSLAHNSTLVIQVNSLGERYLYLSLAHNSTLADLISANFLPVVTVLILATGAIAVASSSTNLTSTRVFTKESWPLKVPSN